MLRTIKRGVTFEKLSMRGYGGEIRSGKQEEVGRKKAEGRLSPHSMNVFFCELMDGMVEEFTRWLGFYESSAITLEPE